MFPIGKGMYTMHVCTQRMYAGCSLFNRGAALFLYILLREIAFFFFCNCNHHSSKEVPNLTSAP